MTLRQHVRILFIAASLAVGVTSLPTPASAAPRTVAVHSVARTGDDPLAAAANSALASWSAFSATGNPVSLRDFEAQRDALAIEAANRLMIDPTRMVNAWRAADTTHQLALVTGFTQLGTPYRHNSSNPGVGFDCSGFTTFAWGQVGVGLARQSRSQIRAAGSRTRDTAMAGDLAYYPGHVMMWLGVDNAIVHAPYTGRSVEVDFISARRAKSIKFGNPIG
jgi:cell wall-associated NlpC family hydrolase